MKFNDYIFIFKFLPIILFMLLPRTSQANSLFTYEETPTKNTNSPITYELQTYNDNKIVARIVRKNSSHIKEDDNTCLDTYLSLRTIYPDGKVVPIDIKLNIQDFNFCVGTGHNPLTISSVKNDFLLVTYTEATDLNNAYTYSAWGMIIDLNGRT